MLSKMLTLTTKLDNAIGDHCLKFHSNDIYLNVCVIQTKTQKGFMRVFSKEEISNVNGELPIIDEFIEEAIDVINNLK